MSDPDLAAAARFAAELIDGEAHRYVERFAPCPNGCRFTYPDRVLVEIDGKTVDWPADQPYNPPWIRVAGPADCALCDDGTIEDEHAPWLDELVAQLRAAADRLDPPEERPRGLDALIPPPRPPADDDL